MKAAECRGACNSRRDVVWKRVAAARGAFVPTRVPFFHVSPLRGSFGVEANQTLNVPVA